MDPVDFDGRYFQGLPFNIHRFFLKSLTDRLPVSPLESPRLYLSHIHVAYFLFSPLNFEYSSGSGRYTDVRLYSCVLDNPLRMQRIVAYNSHYLKILYATRPGPPSLSLVGKDSMCTVCLQLNIC